MDHYGIIWFYFDVIEQEFRHGGCRHQVPITFARTNLAGCSLSLWIRRMFERLQGLNLSMVLSTVKSGFSTGTQCTAMWSPVESTIPSTTRDLERSGEQSWFVKGGRWTPLELKDPLEDPLRLSHGLPLLCQVLKLRR